MRLPVRLACVRHAANVHPEPGSNSPFVSLRSHIRIFPGPGYQAPLAGRTGFLSLSRCPVVKLRPRARRSHMIKHGSHGPHTLHPQPRSVKASADRPRHSGRLNDAICARGPADADARSGRRRRPGRQSMPGQQSAGWWPGESRMFPDRPGIRPADETNRLWEGLNFAERLPGSCRDAANRPSAVKLSALPAPAQVLDFHFQFLDA